jgi:predicted DNA-binding transcriptional regulator YafY
MRADRLLALLLHVQASTSTTTSKLAEALGVSRRTILRDIEALCLAGIPIVAQSGSGGGISLDEQYRVSLNGLRAAEARALFLSGSPKLLGELGLGEAADSAWPKLFAALPAMHRQAVEQLLACIHIDSSWWNDSPAPLLLSDLFKAVYESRTLAVEYTAYDGQESQRLLRPYGLVAKAGTWYLVAEHDTLLRTYRVARFRSVQAQEATFQRPAGFDLKAFWAAHSQAFFESQLLYRYTLRVRRPALDFVRRYHTGRYTSEAAPADVEWTLVALEAENIEAALMLVFGLGENCEIVGPADLYEAVVERGRRVAAAHLGAMR